MLQYYFLCKCSQGVLTLQAIVKCGIQAKGTLSTKLIGDCTPGDCILYLPLFCGQEFFFPRPCGRHKSQAQIALAICACRSCFVLLRDEVIVTSFPRRRPGKQACHLFNVSKICGGRLRGCPTWLISVGIT